MAHPPSTIFKAPLEALLLQTGETHAQNPAAAIKVPNLNGGLWKTVLFGDDFDAEPFNLNTDRGYGQAGTAWTLQELDGASVDGYTDGGNGGLDSATGVAAALAKDEVNNLVAMSFPTAVSWVAGASGITAAGALTYDSEVDASGGELLQRFVETTGSAPMCRSPRGRHS